MVTIQMNGEVIPSDYADVYDYLGYENINPKAIKQALNEANGSDVTLEINSPGGYVDAGSEIYTALKEYQGQVIAKITGQACSAASWIALAADRIEMSPTAQMMIHRASTISIGNSDDLASDLNALNSLDKSFVDLYSQRTGLDAQEVYRLMCNTTWMNAKEAVDKGFADEIMFQNDKKPALVNADGSLSVKPDMINKIKNLLHKKSTENVVKPLQPTQENKKTDSQLQEKLAILFGKEN
ncbi:head maturation protease, ClpP-related [Lactobacillus paragasseri]|uniref:ATP-dependent Clp protease proteolytic subunit n=2 Tax=root TaxID=1 RepID=A0ABQ0N169_9LACO|nr:head maturation protease, ClpP-related [Lactobacillus paragasseri]MBT1276975.1 peptidase [Lactobacillus paragasseri]WRS91607.1 head maturation protease, ClpP-related [Lactobacillus paragasseri]GBA80336.1 ATP-dependent Clp protease proteolytic subunit [Lactobacillus paragasseri]